MSTNIFETFYLISKAFSAQNMEPPASINLASHEDGRRFLMCIYESAQSRYLDPHDFASNFVELADKSLYREIEVMGIKVRWPANRRATPDGSWNWE